ncbi:Ankyrin repeat-containing protein ITN1 [Cardamine amara subsp. amara]|uniref:Ankyrin repeat-containing protein ITN1 n=1 Tax=Cardamine amara subsp. amara TaxID=228776 RepID=A0ABD1B0K9_CARAN
MKESHIKAHRFLKLVCETISGMVKDERWTVAAGRSLIYGTMKGNKEFVVEMIKSNPHLIREFQAEYKNIFQLAVQHRNSKIFNLIYGMDDRKKMMLSEKDIQSNTVLHVAGALSPSYELSKVSGAALKMQREIQWYKEVESLVPEVTATLYNLRGLKPRQVFEEAHEPLRKEAEEWMKYTASACSFVAALIATVTFQAIFTVPGGTDDSSGDPLHLTDSRFMIFTIADTLSFFASCTSVLIFLTILTSRYSFDDFLVSLPKKMILGLSIMFFSIAAMLVAFSTALFTMVGKMPLLVIPVLPLACLPVTLFVMFQYPLLKEMISSTYGNNLFKRDTKPWF